MTLITHLLIIMQKWQVVMRNYRKPRVANGGAAPKNLFVRRKILGADRLTGPAERERTNDPLLSGSGSDHLL